MVGPTDIYRIFFFKYISNILFYFAIDIGTCISYVLGISLVYIEYVTGTTLSYTVVFNILCIVNNIGISYISNLLPTGSFLTTHTIVYCE